MLQISCVKDEQMAAATSPAGIQYGVLYNVPTNNATASNQEFNFISHSRIAKNGKIIIAGETTVDADSRRFIGIVDQDLGLVCKQNLKTDEIFNNTLFYTEETGDVFMTKSALAILLNFF